MANKTWTLLDVDNEEHVDEFAIRSGDVPGASGDFSVSKRTLHGGLREGVDSVRIDNGKLSFVVLPTRGMGIWKAWLGDLEIGWKSPVKGPVHPRNVPLAEPSGLGWLDGFDELLVRCGLESNGAPEFDEKGLLKYPLHGRIANRSAHKLDLTFNSAKREIALTGVVDETRFHFQKLRLTSKISTRLGESSLQIRDEITNLSGSPAEAQMLYHTNFGQPVVDPGSTFVAPIKTVVPRNDRAAEGIATWNSYGNEQAGFEEQVYFMELIADEQGNTRTLLKNAHGTQGVSMTFNKQTLPCYTVWKNTTTAADGYVTGLEPGTNFPNPRSYEGEHGRVAKLAAGGSVTFELGIDIHTSAKEVSQAEETIGKLQGKTEPKVFGQPQENWVAD